MYEQDALHASPTNAATAGPIAPSIIRRAIPPRPTSATTSKCSTTQSGATALPEILRQ